MAKIKCFNCEEEISIQDKFCPFCSEEQTINHNVKPQPKPKQKPTEQVKAQKQPQPETKTSTQKNKPTKTKNTLDNKLPKHTKKPITPSKGQPPKKPIKKIATKPIKKTQEDTVKDTVKDTDKKTNKEPIKPTAIETTPDPKNDEHHKQVVKKHKKKGGIGCNTILLGFAALLIIGFIIKYTFTDDKTEGIKLDGPGTFGRTATGKDPGDNATKRKANIKALIPTIKALKKKGEIEKAYQLAKQGVQHDSKNVKLLTLLVQLANIRNEKVGNSLSKKDNQKSKNKKQLAVKSELKQATAMLLNQLDSPCNRLLAIGETDTKGEIVATCSPTKNSNYTQRYILDTKKGEAWED
ncbi:MAG: hypothetical protein HQL71_00025 [Magnetococcales bacterium]|nr:hypothetical protein [Magnetococcales bacterium]